MKKLDKATFERERAAIKAAYNPEKIKASPNISASALDSVVTCELKYHLNYNLSLRGRLSSGPADFGKFAHSIAEQVMLAHKEGRPQNPMLVREEFIKRHGEAAMAAVDKYLDAYQKACQETIEWGRQQVPAKEFKAPWMSGHFQLRHLDKLRPLFLDVESLYEEKVNLAEYYENAKKCYFNTLEFIRKNLPPGEILVEEPTSTKDYLGTGQPYFGRIDLVVKDTESKTLHIYDFKTSRDKPEYSDIEKNMQLKLYAGYYDYELFRDVDMDWRIEVGLVFLMHGRTITRYVHDIKPLFERRTEVLIKTKGKLDGRFKEVIADENIEDVDVLIDALAKEAVVPIGTYSTKGCPCDLAPVCPYFKALVEVNDGA